MTLNNLRSRYVASATVASLLMFVTPLGAAHQQKEYENFDPGRFERPTVNEWFPLKAGTRFVWEGTTIDAEGDEEAHRVVFTVTDLTKVISGVRTVICWDQDFADGELVETEIVFFAHDNDGAVWSLGEHPEEYEDGKFVDAPTWIHGIKGSKAGILVPAKPKVGTPSFSQGWAPSVDFTDRGVVYQVGQKTTVPFGSFEDVLVIDEWNKEEPDAHALKYYARGVGQVRVGSRGTGDKENLELVKVEHLSEEELAKARDEALKLEKHAYEISKDVYALTEPSGHGSDGRVVETDTMTNRPELIAATDESDTEPPVQTSVRKISDDQAKEIAVKTVPGEAMDVAVERKLGKKTIVVEVISDVDGSETDVIIDMETGEVLATEK